MVEAVRQGNSARSVASDLRVSLDTVQRWVRRAGEKPLDFVDWTDRPDIPYLVANRTAAETEESVLSLRAEMEKSALGECGAEAIHREMIERGFRDVPCTRTINRILSRHGVFDCRPRIRHAPPPRGWYLPDVACGRAEIDQFDIVSGLVIEGKGEVEVLNVISLHGSLVGSWPRSSIDARFTSSAMIEHWSSFGCPAYAQFDNDTRFQGPHQHRDAISRVMRLCLSLQITPVFVPPRETGFQAAIESFNNRWQRKVWDRFHHEALEALQSCSQRYIAAARTRHAVRQESAPARHPVPEDFEIDLQAHPQGKVIFLRRADEHAQVSVLGHIFNVRDLWPHRLVRAEVNLSQRSIQFYSLRRREPGDQRLLCEVPHALPERRFRD